MLNTEANFSDDTVLITVPFSIPILTVGQYGRNDILPAKICIDHFIQRLSFKISKGRKPTQQPSQTYLKNLH